MKIRLQYTIDLDLGDIIKRLTDNPVLAIKDCIKPHLSIRKLHDNNPALYKEVK